MILKRNFNLFRVIQYVRMELAFAISSSLLVLILHQKGIMPVHIPFSIAAILGSALAIFIAFRNNTSYSRWWEARTHWAGIINSSRVLARLIITFTDSHAHLPNYDIKRSEAFKQEMIYKLIAWANALRLELRNHSSWDNLKPYLSQAEFSVLLEKYNKVNFIHFLTGKRIYQAMADGTLSGFDSFQIEGQLLALANYQGGCEKIKHTPLLRQYDYFTRVFLMVFIIILPIALMADFSKMQMEYAMPPVAILISFIFAILGKVGAVNEDPFENRITDVPMTNLCTKLERELKEMLGDPGLTEISRVEDGFLY
jgi:putative membrane protein